MNRDQLELEIDRVVHPYGKDKPNLVLTIGVFKDGRRHMVVKTSWDPWKSVQPETILYEIGSITKVFTATLLAKSIADHLTSLDDSITQYLPELANNPSLVQHPITLRQLTTHTSGLPTLPFKFMLKLLLSDKVRQNPYQSFTENDLLAFLRRYRARPPHNRKFRYSNLGAGLLGHILAKVYQDSFEQAMLKQICQPLGLENTMITCSDGQKKRLVPGFDEKNKPAANWTFHSLAGAGALRSTISDLLTFLEHHVEDGKGPLRGMLSQTHEVLHDEGTGMAIGMNWLIAKRSHIIWHNGGTGGYSSFLGFHKEKKTGVVVLSNYASPPGSSPVDEMGFVLLNRLCS